MQGGSAAAAGGHAAADVSESMAATLWGYMDHASTWDEAVADLRRYVADGHADATMFADIADAIEREGAHTDGENLQGVLGFYPGGAHDNPTMQNLIDEIMGKNAGSSPHCSLILQGHDHCMQLMHPQGAKGPTRASRAA
jgi:hypothetical protein